MKENAARNEAGVCPCREKCPLGEAVRMVGGRWKLKILCAMYLDGTLRYSDLKKKVRGITPAVLSSSMKELEQDGLVTRTQYEEIPPRVDYSITGRGKELWPILHQLAHWALGDPADGGEDAAATQGEVQLGVNTGDGKKE